MRSRARGAQAPTQSDLSRIACQRAFHVQNLYAVMRRSFGTIQRPFQSACGPQTSEPRSTGGGGRRRVPQESCQARGFQAQLLSGSAARARSCLRACHLRGLPRGDIGCGG